MSDYKLREYAHLKSLTYRTLWNKFKEGKLPKAYKDEFGHIYVKRNTDASQNKTIVYARVSSNDRKTSLAEQQARLENYAQMNSLNVIDSYKEIASGMNDNRTVLNKILQRNDWDRGCWSTPIGFNHKEIIYYVISYSVSFLTSFSVSISNSCLS